MAREQELIEEARQLERPTYELTQSTHSDVIVDTIVEFLRQCFSNHPNYTYIPREDSWGPDWEHTKIVIVDKYTEDALFLPVITTSVDSVRTKWLQFSQSPFQTVLKSQMNSDGSIKRDKDGRELPSHYEYTGAYEGTISLIISANDTLEREELCNLIHVILAESGRDTLYMRGIFVSNVTVGGGSEIEYRNDFIYQQTISLDVYSEWRRKIPVGEVLRSIGYRMNTYEGEAPPTVNSPTPPEKLPVYDLDNTPYVVDPVSGQPVLVDLTLDAQKVDAPIALVFDTSLNTWRTSVFWIDILQDTLIPWENIELDILKQNPIDSYIEQAGRALMQATAARALATTQGRLWPDGTRVISNNTFVYSNGRVELKAFNSLDPIIFSATIAGEDEADTKDTVIFRQTSTNKNQSILVVKNLVLNTEGTATSGDVFRRLSTGDSLMSSTLDTPPALDGTSYTTMSAVDLFMIMQFADQPYRFSLSQIIDKIDKVIEQLGNNLISVSNRTAKLSSLINIKQDLLGRSERFLLRRPLGL